MIRAIFMLLLVAAFLGGYHVGRLPGAPDVFAWADQTFQQARQAAGKAVDTATKTPRPLVRKAASHAVRQSTSAVVEVAGKLYRVGVQPDQYR